MKYRKQIPGAWLCILLLSLAAKKAKAQNESGTAQQTIALAMSNALDITFVDNNSSTGNTVSLSFDNVEDYAGGVESASQTIRVRSNKDFDVRVKSSASKFSYSGSASSDPNMSVSSVLAMKIIDNNTGGNISGGFSNYKALSTNNKKIINNADAGNDQTFSVKYKATPGFAYPAGTYTVDIVYTVTQR